jgi:Low-density lipoprotein receptor domain class A
VLLAIAGCRDSSANTVVERLSACDLVSEGKLQARPPGSVRDACYAACEVGAECTELTALYCDRSKSAAIRQCQRDCEEPAPCQDGKGTYTVTQACDGRDQCSDGSDEAGCPEAFFCDGSGARIQAYQRCNGVADCTDGSDEADCSGSEQLFACRTRARGLAQYVPYERVCDLVEDCADGSDEGAAQGCAELRCP